GAPGSFHGDPADRLIVATARTHSLALATHDERIRKSRAVRLWTTGRLQRVAPAAGVQEQAARYGPGHLPARRALSRRRASAPRRSSRACAARCRAPRPPVAVCQATSSLGLGTST